MALIVVISAQGLPAALQSRCYAEDYSYDPPGRHHLYVPGKHEPMESYLAVHTFLTLFILIGNSKVRKRCT